MPRNPNRANPIAKLVLVTAVAGLLVAGAAVRPAPAEAASPCWKLLLNDWYDGRIDQTYPVHCYREALKHLPADVQTYSSAHDDILRALQSAIAKGKTQHKPVGSDTLVPPATKTTADSGSGTGTTTTTASGGGSQGRQDGGGLAGQVDSSSPSSVPVPLIVLGALALLLVAAGGAGLAWKRVQSRRPSP